MANADTTNSSMAEKVLSIPLNLFAGRTIYGLLHAFTSHFISMQPRYPAIPDVRDGLTEVERAILLVLHDARKEYGDRMMPTALIYGRVVEILDLSWEEFQRALAKVG